MTLAAIIEQIVVIERSVRITSPIAFSACKAYTISPNSNQDLTDRVSFLNWPDAAVEMRMGDSREDNVTVQIDCYVKDNRFDAGASIALAIFDATWAAFDAERPAGRRLGNTVDMINLRSERPLLETLEWNGKGYPGFHIFLDLVYFTEVVPL